jgi:hypothetical protein
MNLLEFFYGRWGRLVPRVSFSSDALGMPWECMGVYIFFRNHTLDLVLHSREKQDVESLDWNLSLHRDIIKSVNTKCSN